MNRKKIELRIASLSNSRVQAGAYALVLNEINGNRSVPIIIGTAEAQAIAVELRSMRTPRPLTHALFASVLDALEVRLLRVIIYKAEQGIFYSYLYLRSGEMILRVDARTSDAVAMALHMRAPIFIYEDVMNSTDLLQQNEILHAQSDTGVPEKSTIETLEDALQKAIDEEDYEQAAQLRDQINQLKTS